ncbi:MAG: hypothetical protein OEX03_09410 [Gammaproteobacteria bacterium]|nr:hypothetical protein [Gammaproteobacteria bacterium]
MRGGIMGRVFFGSVSLSRDKEMNSPAVRQTAYMLLKPVATATQQNIKNKKNGTTVPFLIPPE